MESKSSRVEAVELCWVDGTSMMVLVPPVVRSDLIWCRRLCVLVSTGVALGLG